MTSVEAADATIAAALAELEVEHSRRAEGQFMVTLPGSRRLQTQCWLLGPGGEAIRVDFLWWQERTVGEADGLAKYVKYGDSRRDPLPDHVLQGE